MTAKHSITLEVTDAVLDQLRAIAQESGRSAEAVAGENLELTFGPVGKGIDALLARLPGLTDEQLWIVSQRRPSRPQRERLKELTALAERGTATSAHKAEADALIDEIDQFTMLRTHALRLLQERGYDIPAFLAS